jgi:hypothetical protein
MATIFVSRCERRPDSAAVPWRSWSTCSARCAVDSRTPEASCGSIGLAGSERMAVGAASFSSREPGGSARPDDPDGMPVGASALSSGTGGLVASHPGGMAAGIGGDSSRSAGGMTANEPWTAPDALECWRGWPTPNKRSGTTWRIGKGQPAGEMQHFADSRTSTANLISQP